MRKAIIVTPVHGENLGPCIASVDAQELPDGWDLIHVVVADGRRQSKAELTGSVMRHWMGLPHGANDIGCTPRGIGSAWAVSLLPDLLTFLDADNTIDPEHIATLVDLHESSGRRVVAARRRFLSWQGEVMPHVRDYSDGASLVDSNCLSLMGAMVALGMRWTIACRYARGPWDGTRKNHTGADGYFWRDHVRPALSHRDAAPIPVATRPTVNYTTRWLAHYEGTEFAPPEECIEVDWTQDPPLRRTVRP